MTSEEAIETAIAMKLAVDTGIIVETKQSILMEDGNVTKMES